MSFWMDKEREQPLVVLGPEDAPLDAIISPDTHREVRIPPGQSRTRNWPVLDASGPPRIDMDKWTLSISGLVHEPVSFTWKEFLQLPRVKVFSDFHCVTRWSRLGNIWEGFSTRTLMTLAGDVKPEAKFAIAHGYDRGFTTNLPLADLLAEDALVAITHDGQELTEAHGGPCRLIVPQLYAWKSAKWLSAIELLDHDEPGFWESNGYHRRGDPWQQQRYSW